MLEVLANTEHQDFPAYARFNVTTAHRGNNSSADLPDFTFAAGSLDDYDELWLFGINSGNRVQIPGSNPPRYVWESYLNDAELQVIGDFMQAGGGVLAMGDHEDLGLGLCASVPRVRNMRKWWFRDEMPPGSAPGTGLRRPDAQ